MRIAVLAFLTIVAVWAGGPVRAQTYNPAFPVCLHVYDLGANYFECAYSSMAQCAASASGRAADCLMNPYFAGAQERWDQPRYRQPRTY